jgi:hypothetical protein
MSSLYNTKNLWGLSKDAIHVQEKLIDVDMMDSQHNTRLIKGISWIKDLIQVVIHWHVVHNM